MNPDQSPPTASATLTVRPSVPDDVAYLAPKLCNADLYAILATGSLSAEDSLERGLTHSIICLTAVDQDGNPVAMFGSVAYPQDAAMASLWLLGSDELRDHEESLGMEIQRYLEVMHRTYPVISGLVDCRNEVAIERLSRFGFELTAYTVPAPGTGSLPLREAYRVRNDECVIH